MREMDAQADAFAAMKGTLARARPRVLQAYRAFDEIGKLQ